MKQREVRFRAWDGERMWPSDAIGVAGGRCLVLDTGKSKDWPLMQYTGLKDKNGREIYEGDIINSGQKRGSDGSAILYQLKWGDESAGWDVDQIGRYCMTGGIDLKKVEVIGNIHENPELLKA